MKKAVLFITLASLILFLFAYCSNGDTPDIKKNPHPVMRYDVTVAVDGAPGPFDSAGGFMQYEVNNIDCVPVTGAPMNAMRIPPGSFPRITFKKIANNLYKGTVFADYLQDENYFGLGVCHWSLTAITVELNVNKLTLFSHLSPEEMASQESVPSYFVRRDYLDNDHERSSSGEPHPSNYPPDRQDGIFSMTLIAKEISP